MRRYLLALLALVPIALCCGAVLPYEFALEITGLLAFGWATFLKRVLGQMTVDWSGVQTALICLTGLTLGLHYFCGWLYRQIAGNAALSPARHWRLRWTMSVLAVVVLMFVAGIAAIGLTHQTVWLVNSPKVLSYRSAYVSDRTVSTNNLKYIGLSVHTYNDTYKRTPPGTLFSASGAALHGWQTLLLPFIDEEATYKLINHELPWHDAANRSAFRTVIPTYTHPAADQQSGDDTFAFSHYAGNAYVFGTDRPLRIAQSFPDGASETILAGEVRTNFKPWGHPTNYRDPGLGIGHPNGFASPTSDKYALFLMADASCRTFTADVSPEVLKAYAMPAGRQMPADWVER